MGILPRDTYSMRRDKLREGMHWNAYLSASAINNPVRRWKQKFVLRGMKGMGVLSGEKYEALQNKLQAYMQLGRYLPPFPGSPGKKDYLAILACVKNEAPYIREWIEYHRLQGVESFYLLNNESADNLGEVLAPYVADGTVVLSRSIPGLGLQIASYNAALVAYGDFARWLAIIDCDEFLLPMREGERVADILKDFESYPALALNMRMFDTNRHVEKPPGLVIENYTRCVNDQYVKCIVDPKRTIGCLVHNHYYDAGAQAVSEDFTPCPHSFSTAYMESRLRINHYFTKSLAEYRAKLARTDASIGAVKPIDEKRINRPNGVEDTVILRWLPALRAAMEHNAQPVQK